jgi:hypothetical protein
MYPRIRTLRDEEHAHQKWKKISSKGFATRKAIILESEAILTQRPHISTEEADRLVNAIIERNSGRTERGLLSKAITTFGSYIPGPIFGTSMALPSPCGDAEFLKRLPAICDKFPVLVNLANGAWDKATEYFASSIEKSIDRMAHQIEDIQIDHCRKQLDTHRSHSWKKVLDESRESFLTAVKARFRRHAER